VRRVEEGERAPNAGVAGGNRRIAIELGDGVAKGIVPAAPRLPVVRVREIPKHVGELEHRLLKRVPKVGGKDRLVRIPIGSIGGLEGSGQAGNADGEFEVSNLDRLPGADRVGAPRLEPDPVEVREVLASEIDDAVPVVRPPNLSVLLTDDAAGIVETYVGVGRPADHDGIGVEVQRDRLTRKRLRGMHGDLYRHERNGQDERTEGGNGGTGREAAEGVRPNAGGLVAGVGTPSSGASKEQTAR